MTHEHVSMTGVASHKSRASELTVQAALSAGRSVMSQMLANTTCGQMGWYTLIS